MRPFRRRRRWTRWLATGRWIGFRHTSTMLRRSMRRLVEVPGFQRLAYGMSAIDRALHRALRWLARLATAPLPHSLRRAGAWLWACAMYFPRKGLVLATRTLSPLRRITLGLDATVAFAMEWWSSRRALWGHGGLPAFLVAAALLVLAGLGGMGAQDVYRRYDQAVDLALERNDLQQAAALLEKLQSLAPAGPQITYRLALLAQKRGETKEAWRLMRSLAPPQPSFGLAEAHSWLARHLARGKTQWTTEEISEVEHHLRAALQQDPYRYQDRESLVQLLLGAGRVTDATPELQHLASADPRWRLELAVNLLQQGQRHAGLLQLQQAAATAQERSREDPARSENYLIWSRAELVRGDPAAALRILDQALQHVTGPPREELLQAASRVQQTLAENAATPEEQAACLSRAALYWPGNVPALGRLSLLTRRESLEEDQLRRQLETALAEGRFVTEAHLALAALQARGGRFSDAQLHLRAALRIAPQSTNVLRNLAWVMLRSYEGDAQAALNLCDLALQQPKVDADQVQRVRGEALVQLQRWEDALQALESSLPHRPDDAELHGLLATVYRNLGNTAMEQEHRRQQEQAGQALLATAPAQPGSG